MLGRHWRNIIKNLFPAISHWSCHRYFPIFISFDCVFVCHADKNFLASKYVCEATDWFITSCSANRTSSSKDEKERNSQLWSFIHASPTGAIQCRPNALRPRNYSSNLFVVSCKIKVSLTILKNSSTFSRPISTFSVLLRLLCSFVYSFLPQPHKFYVRFSPPSFS